ncbi:MAG: type I-B CRISPR-associated protein Cas7/Cst2/DevR [Caldilineaceae bacterium]
MSFITGLLLIDAPASALNNGQGEETKAKVKSIHVYPQQDYPYVSAQSFRYWLRESMQRTFPDLPASPVYTAGAGKKQQAFTEGNPISYWDDDLLGYMRAEKSETVTRISPLRTSTLVSVTPVELVEDFGVMARAPKAEGDKEGVLLHGHEFYRATLQMLFSLDLRRAGTFTDERRTGYKNLGKGNSGTSRETAGLAYVEKEGGYRLPIAERTQRVQSLLRALGRLEGGAKQTLHYTDVTPAFVIAAVTTGGNNMFGRVIHRNEEGRLALHEAALQQALTVFGSDLQSSIYVGRAEGFMDNTAAQLSKAGLTTHHPRQALDALATALAAHPEWMD